MPDRDWDRELANIDRRLGQVPDATTAPTPAVQAPSAAPPPAASRRLGTVDVMPGRRSWRVQVALLLRLAVGVAVVCALVAWPYAATCGAGLAYYLGLVALLGVAGLITATGAWRHRAPFVHVLGLAMIAAAGVLAARDVLPRVGYAIPTAEHPASWRCG